MKKHLIPDDLPFYKANLHTHSTLSDGKLTPKELKELYRSQGYQILAITDHELCIDHSYMTDDQFLMLTGYEIGGINNPQPWNRRSKTYHFCMISKTPDNTRQVWRIPNIPEEAKPLISGEPVINHKWEYTTESINRLIAMGREQGYFVIYNHPAWSLQSYHDYVNLEGIWGTEVYNAASFVSGFDDDNPRVYQDLLTLGKHVMPVAADDLHNYRRPQNISGFTMIGAEKLEYGAVAQAMEQGMVYASTGPKIHSLSYENGTVSIRCDPAARINLVTQYRFCKFILPPPGQTVTEAEFDISPWMEDCTEAEAASDAPFFRLMVTAPDGTRAYTRPYRRSDIL